MVPAIAGLQLWASLEPTTVLLLLLVEDEEFAIFVFRFPGLVPIFPLVRLCQVLS